MTPTDAARKTFCRIDGAVKAMHPDVKPWRSPSAAAWEVARAAYCAAVDAEQEAYRAQEQAAMKAALARQWERDQARRAPGCGALAGTALRSLPASP